MTVINDAEYLSRPLLDDVVFKIDRDYVRIASLHTSFVNETRIIQRNKDELLSLYSKVLGMAKSRNTSISYKRHMKKSIIDGWADYEYACEDAGKVFDSIIELADVVQRRGIHIGCSDDIQLDKLATARNKHMEFHWRTNIISQISAIEHNLREFDWCLSSENSQLSMIYL